MRIERLGAVLGAIGPRPLATEIADVIWLASHIDQLTTSPQPDRSNLASKMSARPSTDPKTIEPNDAGHKSGTPATDVHEGTGAPQRGALYAAQSGLTPGISAVALLAPTAPMLEDRLAIARALRPLKRRVSTRNHRLLDEHATAQRAAEILPDPRGWVPVMRPGQERWLDLTIVFDDSSTMTMWRPLARELRRAFTEVGAFRSIQELTLVSDPEGLRLAHAADPRRVSDPTVLTSSPGRRVVLIVSDCASLHWWHGDVARVLAQWARSCPVAILQPLPERLWSRTAAPTTPATVVMSRPGAPTSRVRYVSAEYPGERPLTGLPVPVLEITPNWLSSWAHMVAGRPFADAATAVTFVGPHTSEVADEAPLTEISPRERVLRFRQTATPEAFRLAAFIATTIPTLPVMRLVLRAMLDKAHPTYLAEVVLSGLLRVVDADAGHYQFVDGTREILLETLSRSESRQALEVLRKVSLEIEAIAGQGADRFQALLGASSVSSRYSLPSTEQPFALISSAALARLLPPTTQTKYDSDIAASSAVPTQRSETDSAVTMDAQQEPELADDAAASPTAARSGDDVETSLVALWRSYGESHDQGQRDRLVLHYAPLVKYVAGRVATGLPIHVDVADLVQSGIFGLVDAIEKFEPERGLKFETYAIQRIRGAILDDLRAQDWVPRSVHSRARDVERALERLGAKLQRTPSDRELAAELNIGLAELRELYGQLRLTSVVALDALIAPNTDGSSLAESLPDDAAEDPVASLVDQDSRIQLAEAIAGLAERDRVVVTLYYFENLTLAEIGKVLGVTESRAVQLHNRAVLRLRALLNPDRFA